MSMNKAFCEVKKKVLDIIRDNKTDEVTRTSKINRAGIYMLYVDNFEDEKIIPFYIGQTGDFQRRHKQHFFEILSLNRLENSCYKYALQRGEYGGHYRACKIFSYMVNHKCKINDLHMIILEEIENEEERKLEESRIINELEAPFVGFNQLNSYLKYIDFTYKTCEEAELKKAMEVDIKKLSAFPGCGYNNFNWYLHGGGFDAKQRREFLQLDGNEEYDQYYRYEHRLSEISEEMSKLKSYVYYECEREVWKFCKEDIKDFFLKRGLQSEAKQKSIPSILLFDCENDKKKLFNYFKRYNKNTEKNILDILNEQHGEAIAKIREKIKMNQGKYRELDNEKEELLDKAFQTLFPMVNYVSHPLGSMYEKISFPTYENESNICHINIEYTCLKTSFDCVFSPKICRIDYYIVKGNEVFTKGIFINNPLKNFFEKDEMYYYERGNIRQPFNICLIGSSLTHIPVTMEYRNGINEDSFRDEEMEDWVDVFKEIDSLIDSETKIIYTTSGYKSTIKDWVGASEYRGIKVVRKLANMCR